MANEQADIRKSAEVIDNKKIAAVTSNIKELNDQALTNTISNISNILVSLDILADAAREAASAIASVFNAAASIDVGLSNDLERMQVAFPR